MIRGYDRQPFQGGEGLVAAAVDAGAYARSLGRAHGSVGIVKFYGCSGNAGKGFAEDVGS